MLKRLFTVMLVLIATSAVAIAQSASDVTGLWFMFDLNAKEPSGIVQVYEHDGKIYGRTLVSYEKDGSVRNYTESGLDKAPHLAGNPPMLGLDVIWGLQWDEKKQTYNNGSIMDPRKKSPYNAEIKRSGDLLKMRGSVGPFGATIDWTRATEADLKGVRPYSAPKPVIYYDAKNKLLSSPITLS
jgi:Uncharacterized protein conserved in bacteria (DUF2147)